jgi:hypothetical protein
MGLPVSRESLEQIRKRRSELRYCEHNYERGKCEFCYQIWLDEQRNIIEKDKENDLHNG